MINVRMPDEETQLSPRILVIGVGGGGCNAVNNMIESNLEGVEYLVCNTDAQALKSTLSERRLQLGVNVTRGLGGGAKPDVGRAAAEESLDEITSYLEGANMVFITAGMGGATGTGAAPVIARAARDMNILTVGVVTKPFHFEGHHRMRIAESGIEELQQYVDTLLIIPNQNLFRVANEKTTFADAFKVADNVLHSGVRGVTDLIVMPGLINLDFADIRSVMSEMGKAMMGTGEAEGDRRAVEAAEAAISNPLLEDVSMEGARGVLINITGGNDMTLFEVDEACNRIRDEVDPEANIIFGSTFDQEAEGLMRVSVVATGIDNALNQGRDDHKTPGQGQSFGGISQQSTTPWQSSGSQGTQQGSGSARFSQSDNNYASSTNVPFKNSNPTRQDETASSGSTAVSASQQTQDSVTQQASAPKSLFGQNGAQTSHAHSGQKSQAYPSSSDMYQQTAQTGNIATAQKPRDEEKSEQAQGFIPEAPQKIDETPVFSATQQSQQPTQQSFDQQSGTPTADTQQQQPSAPSAPAPLRVSEPMDEKRRRSSSLFERLTGRLSEKDEEQQNLDSQNASQSQEASHHSSQNTGQVSLASSSSTDKTDDDLDIPAFLRRQAN